jgi:CDP-L-myo-inositol myo-inositolphosphotransferase
MAQNNHSRIQGPLAVVLAAGEGSRLSNINGGKTKPATPLLGLSLGERTLCTCAKAGVRRFLIVLGHRSEEVRSHFEEIGRKRGFTVETTVAEDWALGNGASALAAADLVGEESFFLTMVDHMVDPGIFKRLLEDPPREGEVCLAIDRNREGLFDVADVTKVQLAGSRIQAIGKELKTWEAADTGVFLCTTALFESLKRARSQERHCLSDGVQELAETGAMRAVDVTGQAWLDVDGSEAFKEANQNLLSSLRQGKGGEDGFISHWLNRPVSVRLSALLARTRVTPNQITIFSFLITLAGAGFLAAGSHLYSALGGLLIQAGSIVDGCDGEVARLKNWDSPRGAWLDTVLDRYTDLAIPIAVTFCRGSSACWRGAVFYLQAMSPRSTSFAAASPTQMTCSTASSGTTFGCLSSFSARWRGAPMRRSC